MLQVRFKHDWFQLVPPALLLFFMACSWSAGCEATAMLMLLLVAGLEAVTSVVMWIAGCMSSSVKSKGSEGGLSMVSVVICVELVAALLWHLQATKLSMIVVMGACAVWVVSVPYVKSLTTVMHCCYPEFALC